jgi:hypothetical protein
VRGVVRVSGRCDAQDFIAGLDDRYTTRYQRYFERLRDGHQIKSPENWRRISDTQPPVFELKVDKYRVYLIRQGSVWYVTHGRIKPADSKVSAEASKCIEIYWERGSQ